MIDAVTFVREKSRMCSSNIACITCPAYNKKCGSSNDVLTIEEAEELVGIVEKWSKKPITKNNDELNRILAESFVVGPGLHYDDDGNLILSRKWLNAEYKKLEV